MSAGQFQPTRWSLIQRAASADEQLRERAWREFHEIYEAPLLWFIRSYGWGKDECEDHLQSFLAKLAERDWLGDAEREDVKMRSFLLTRLKRHLNDIRKHRQAEKRGGKAEFVSADVDETQQLLGSTDADPSEIVEREFDRRWAQAIVDRAVLRLQENSEKRGRGDLFEALRGQLTDDTPDGLRAAAAQVGKSEGAIRMALQRLREKLRRNLRDEIAETLPPGADVEDEFRYLASVLG